jgi:hypothetical protein
MMIMKRIRHFLIFIFLCMPMSSFAAMVSSETLLQQAQHATTLTAEQSIALRAKIQQELLAMGVAPEITNDRVSQLTELEIAALHNKIESAPAGSAIVGELMTIFVIFVITDLLGATDIFPFIKSIN